MRRIVGYAVSAFSGQQQRQGKSEGRDRPRTHCRVSGVTTTFKYESEPSKLSFVCTRDGLTHGPTGQVPRALDQRGAQPKTMPPQIFEASGF